MKKLLPLLLALIMILSAVPFASAEEVIEIDFWHSWGTGPNYEAVTTIVNGFNEAFAGKYHVTETYTGGYADTLSKAVVAYAANENPTVSVVDACMTLNANEQGIMANLSEIMANDAEYDVEQFMDGFMVFSTDPDGNIWSIPFARSTQIMYVNKDLVKTISEDKLIPDTFTELWEMAEAWVAANNTPFYSCPCAGGFLAQMITAYGGEYFSKDGEGVCLYLNNAWEDCLNMWTEAINNGWYQIPSLSTAGYYEDFLAGKLPIMMTSTGSLTAVLSEAQFDVGVGYLPGFEIDGEINRAVQTGGANLMLYSNKTDEELEAGWEFIKYATSTESNVMHSFTTGYVLNHVGLEDSEEVQAKWAEVPELKIAYDQLNYVHEAYVSIYTSETDLEINKLISAWALDGVSVEDTMEAIEVVVEQIFPNGVVDTYE